MILTTSGGRGVDRAPRPYRKSGRLTSMQRRRAGMGIVFISPAVIMLVVFFIIPMGLLLWMSFNNWPLLGNSAFIGLKNYEDALDDVEFRNSLLFTILFAAISTPVQVVLGYGLAIIVRSKMRGVGLFRTIYFLPVVVGTAAASYMYVVMLQPGTGLFDRVLQLVGLTDGHSPAVTNSGLALFIVVVVTAWKNVGTAMVLFMAGMQAVPDELDEAAKVDGAGWFRREFSVTLPLVRQSLALVLILTLTASFLAFDQFYIITRGGPEGSTITAVLWIYTVGFIRYRLGYSAALALFLVIALVIVSAFQLRILRDRKDPA
jgi:multiple sugar transport system permease protein